MKLCNTMQINEQKKDRIQAYASFLKVSFSLFSFTFYVMLLVIGQCPLNTTLVVGERTLTK